MLPIVSDGKDEVLFTTAYCLIPFLKNKSLIENYKNLIDKGMNYLYENIKVNTKIQVHSIAAYVAALKGNNSYANTLLDQAKIMPTHVNDKLCFKTNRDFSSCSEIHTAFIALAHLKLNESGHAEPMINFLIDYNLKYSATQTTFKNAILTEPIVEMGIIKANNKTQLNIVFSNEHSFRKEIKINEMNSQNVQYVTVSKYSKTVSAIITGHGYCTLTMIMEEILITDVVKSTFTINIFKNITSKIKNQKTITICASYNPKPWQQEVLLNVIYEINMPSGYIYSHINDLYKKVEIKVRK